LKPEQLEALRQQLEQLDLGGMVIPNFAIGAILLMKFAKEAAQYFDHAEIIELHHNRKADAPSGTSIKTAQLMSESCAQFGTTNQPEKETITGARGATTKAGIHIHSVRLPGLLAHEEVLLGGPGQLLTLRHDSFDRTCFMPGVLLCIKKVVDLSGLVYGMEEIL
jgi:4-hydroxy-tetrahydrodipicolinate reductase